MRGNQLARQWRMIRAIEASRNGLTVSELAELEGIGVRPSVAIWFAYSKVRHFMTPWNRFLRRSAQPYLPKLSLFSNVFNPAITLA